MSLSPSYFFFSDISTKQQEILKNDYVYKKFAQIEFSKNILPNLDFKSKLTQKLNPLKNYSILNKGDIILNYRMNKFEFEKKFTTNGNIAMHVNYNIQSFNNPLSLYAKFLSNHLEKKIQPKFGIKALTDHISAKASFDYETSLTSFELLLNYLRKRNDLNDKFGFGIGFCSNLKMFSIHKTAFWYGNDDLNISLVHKNPEKNDILLRKVYISVFNKINQMLDIALQFKYDSEIDKPYKMLFGFSLKKWDNIICKAKIDDSFGLASSFIIQLNENLKFIFSSKIDLNIQPKKQSISYVPLGLKIHLFDN